jgi:hypothetical protein
VRGEQRQPPGGTDSEEVASFENRLANVEASLMVLKWMVGCNLILTVAIVGVLFFVLASGFAADAGTTAGSSAGSAGAFISTRLLPLDPLGRISGRAPPRPLSWRPQAEGH